MVMKLKTVPSFENFSSDVSELPVVITLVIPEVISVVIIVVISVTFISVVSWSVELLCVVSGIGNITSFVYKKFRMTLCLQWLLEK